MLNDPEPCTNPEIPYSTFQEFSVPPAVQDISALEIVMLFASVPVGKEQEGHATKPVKSLTSPLL